MRGLAFGKKRQIETGQMLMLMLLFPVSTATAIVFVELLRGNDDRDK